MSEPHPAPLVSKLFQEQNISQECRDLMASLPRQLTFASNHVYQYHSFWFFPFHLEGIHDCRQHFQAHASDIILVTTPKSGTTWLKALAYAVVNRRHYASDSPNHPLHLSNPHGLVPFLESPLRLRGEVPDLTSLASPRLLGTHMPFTLLPESAKSSSCKVVYLCRDPKDTLVSFWHFLNKRQAASEKIIPLEEVSDCYCRGVSPYGPFWEHILGYWKESLERPEKVLFLKYEEMKEDPAALVRRLAKFLGDPFSQEEEHSGMVAEIVKLCSFESLSNLEVNKKGRWWSGTENRFFFRRGVVGDWKNYLTPEVAEQLDNICKEKFPGPGLKF